MKKYIYIFAALLSLASCQPEVKRVYGRYVPERKDDFAWENEYAAFRMYGPALRPENPSNGVDLWLKSSSELIVDSFYYRELALGLSYHINHGKGLDCYKVGHTAGCGGLVVVCDSQTYVGGAYDRWEIIEQTNDKLVFRLEYDSLLVGNQVLQESITITAQAGQLFNKAEVVLTSASNYQFESPLLVGGGIYMHDTIDNYIVCDKCGLVSYAEDALSDKNAAKMNYEHNGSTTQGRSYVAVITPGASQQGIVDGNLVSLKPYTLGDTLVYYFGAGWSNWYNEDNQQAFATDEAWFEAIKTIAATL